MGSVKRAALLAVLSAGALGGCAQDETKMCTIYQIFGEARIPVKTVEVKNDAECDALLEEYRNR